MEAVDNYRIAAMIVMFLYVGLRSILILEEGEGRRILRPAFLASCNFGGGLRGLRNSPNLGWPFSRTLRWTTVEPWLALIFFDIAQQVDCLGFS